MGVVHVGRAAADVQIDRALDHGGDARPLVVRGAVHLHHRQVDRAAASPVPVHVDAVERLAVDGKLIHGPFAGDVRVHPVRCHPEDRLHELSDLRIAASVLLRCGRQAAVADHRPAGFVETLQRLQCRGLDGRHRRHDHAAECDAGDGDDAVADLRTGQGVIVDEVEVDAAPVDVLRQCEALVARFVRQTGEVLAAPPLRMHGRERIEQRDVGTVGALAHHRAEAGNVAHHRGPVPGVGLTEVDQRRFPLVPAAHAAVEPAVAVVEVDAVGEVLVGPGDVLILGHAPTGAPIGAHRRTLAPVDVLDGAGHLGVDQAAVAGVGAERVLIAGDVKVAHVAEVVDVVIGLAQDALPAPGGDGREAQAAFLVPDAEGPIEMLLQQDRHRLVVVAADLVGAGADVPKQRRDLGQRIVAVVGPDAIHQCLRVDDAAAQHPQLVVQEDVERLAKQIAELPLMDLRVELQPA